MTKKFFKNFPAKAFSIAVLLICLGLSLTLADLFSNLITTSAFSISSNKVRSSNFSLYAISLYSTNTQAQANDLASNARQKNCAGYVYKTDSSYLVLASAYENEADAKSVEANLKSSKTSCEVITIDFPKIEFSLTLSGNEKTALTSAVCIYRDMYKKLYDLSVSVDTNLSSEIESKVSLASIISDFAKVKASFESVLGSKITSQLLCLKLSLISVENILSDLSNFSDSKIPYSSEIKHSYFEILMEQIKLAEKI